MQLSKNDNMLYCIVFRSSVQKLIGATGEVESKIAEPLKMAPHREMVCFIIYFLKHFKDIVDQK